MVKNLVSGPILILLAQIWTPKLFFSWILTLLDVRNCWKLSMYVVSRKTNEANFKKWQKKPSFGPNFSPFGWNLGHQTFFSKIWVRQSLDIMVSYDHAQYQKKLMIKSWENLVTDGQIDDNDFIGRCRTNVEHAIFFIEHKYIFTECKYILLNVNTFS